LFLLLNLLLIFFGIGLFGLSYSLVRKRKGDTEGLKLYGAFAYGSVVFIVSGVAQIIGHYISFSWWYSSVILIILEIADNFLIRPGFNKSGKAGLKKKNLLEILFSVVICLSAILLKRDLSRGLFAKKQGLSIKRKYL
jgi:hypothetical protein